MKEITEQEFEEKMDEYLDTLDEPITIIPYDTPENKVVMIPIGMYEHFIRGEKITDDYMWRENQ